MTTCPACNAPNQKLESLLGCLGLTEHHRCRYCGASYSRQRRARRVHKPIRIESKQATP